jgi:Rab5 GDP/GTP exchange factor
MTNVELRTLYGMFPNLDKDVIDDVVRLKEGRCVVGPFPFPARFADLPHRVGLAVDACLALSAGG